MMYGTIVLSSVVFVECICNKSIRGSCLVVVVVVLFVSGRPFIA